MSVVMDLNDACGALGGLCLLAVVRDANGVPDADSLARTRQRLGLGPLVEALVAYTGADATMFDAAIEALFAWREDYWQTDNVNLQLGLLAQRPLPLYPFVVQGGVDDAALYLPLLEASRNFGHAAVRARMHAGPLPVGTSDELWRELARFVRRVAGGDAMANAIALSTVANVVSDVRFFNFDTASRADDPIVAEGVSRVLEELLSVPKRCPWWVHGL